MPEADAPRNLYKFIVCGREASGKTCLLLQFTDHRFRTTHHVTIGVEFGSREVQVSAGAHTDTVKVHIWDSAGQERFRSVVRSYFRGAVGALVVYDVTNRASFDEVESWIQETRTNAGDAVVIMLVGNKSDLEQQRTVKYDEGVAVARKHGIGFVETSALTGSNVEEAFTALAQAVYERSGAMPQTQLGPVGGAGAAAAAPAAPAYGGVQQAAAPSFTAAQYAQFREQQLLYQQQQQQGAVRLGSNAQERDDDGSCCA